jgi:uncharacterized protein (DUF2141 family)
VARRVCIFATVFLSFASVAAQVGRDQKPPAAAAAQPATASLSGVVVSADLGRPVRRATVTASSAAGSDFRSLQTAQTDDAGSFTFPKLAPGEYILSANKGGFVESVYGQRQPGSGRLGTPIRLAAGQQLKDLSLPLARGGVLTGVVLDEVGDPAFGITVRAYKWVMKSGERTLVDTASGVTDDRGIYRIPALLPGEYVAGVMPPAGDMMSIKLNGATEYVKVLGTVELNRFELAADTPFVTRVRDGAGAAGPPKTGFARSFYPGVGQAGMASAITLGPGEERPGVDFSLQVVPLARVSGTVMSPAGPVSGATVQLVDRSQPPGFGGRTARTSNGGGFVFDGVPPGQYALTTRAAQKGAAQLEGGAQEAVAFLAKAADNLKAAQVGNAINAASLLWAATEIAVDGRDQADVQLTLEPGVNVAGRVVTETGAEVAYSRMSVGLTPIGVLKNELGVVGPAAVDAAGRFTIKGVSPGRYRLTVMGGMPGGHSVASAVFAGQDILDVPLEMTGAPGPADGLVTLTTKTTELTGTIQDAAGQAASAVTVIVFSTDERFWTPESRRIQGVRPATDGRYQVRNLPPGDYRLVVVSDVEPGRWFDPAFLRQLGGFATITLGNGGRVVQDFRVK